jgi:hypothetical protein
MCGTPYRFFGIFKTEFVPSAAPQYEVWIMEFVETKTFLFSAWTLSMFTIFHINFGTLLFAITTFISSRDALTVVAKYIGSAVVCRIVLLYELAGLRESFSQPDKNNSIPIRV